MLKNYLLVAWRNLKRDTAFASINIFGLALALAVCMLISLYVTNELNYDRYNDKADRIFRVISDIHINGNSINGNFAPASMGPALVSDYPQIEKAVRIRIIPGNILVKKNNETFEESNAVIADSTLFSIFTLPFLSGSAKTALHEPNSLVISERIAKKYFNNEQVTGQIVQINDDTANYQITGVIKDIPVQSHFHFDFIRSLSGKNFNGGQQWINLYSSTYLLAKPGTTTADIDKILQSIVSKYIHPQIEQHLHNNATEMAKQGDYFRFYAMPLNRIHLYSALMGEFEPNGHIQYVYIFTIIAVFILLVACVNFVNLSTARSAQRTKEVGIRKVLGGLRKNLIAQFLTESVVTSLIALLLSIAIAIILLPYFNRLSGSQVAATFFFEKRILISVIPVSLLLGLFAGSYPAFFLSAFQPISVLKGKPALRFKSGWLRNNLVIFQFVTVIILIAGTLVIYKQLNYIRHKDVGYNREQVLIIHNTKYLGPHAQTFKQELEKLSGVMSVTMTGYLPNTIQNGTRGFFKNTGATATESVLMGDWRIDEDYIHTLGMKMIEGRNFSPAMPTDSSAVLINETAARMLGYSNPIGKVIYTGPEPLTAFRIIGVVKDFNAGSLHNKIDPIVFSLQEERSAIAARINSKHISELISQIRELYASMNTSDLPFSFSFLDDAFNKLYEHDERTGRIFTAFAVFAIFISCLGLFGLVTYAAEQRSKEISIRKVLGARIYHVLLLLSAEFVKLIIIAAAIACPLAWWGMNKWLQDFSYRIKISLWIFLVSCACAIGIAMITISFKVIKTAIANPVKSLKTE